MHMPILNAEKQTFTRKGWDYATMHMLLCIKEGSEQSPLQSKNIQGFSLQSRKE